MTERDRKVRGQPAGHQTRHRLLTKKTKDLQIAAWLTEAWLKQKGFARTEGRSRVCVYGLVDKFWDTLYPELEDGDAQSRGAPLGFIGTKLEIPLKLVPVVEKAPYSLLDYQQSRDVGYEDQAKTDEAKKKRAAAGKGRQAHARGLRQGFRRNSKEVLCAGRTGSRRLSAERSSELKKMCDEKFGDDGPAFGPLKTALEAERHLIHGFLQKKREKEPDPVEAVAAAEAATGADGEAATAAAAVRFAPAF